MFGAPQTLPHTSERFYVGEVPKKTTSRTQDAESRRRERKFTKLLECLMPICLLPLVFGDHAGIIIYCVLVTVMGLTGRLLPPAVAAMLPIVILPMAGAFSADDVAAEFLGPRVLVALLLFTIANVGDETTLFSRMCLYALQRYALRIQPLFLTVQLVVLVLSLFLPSSFIVIFSTILIERFIATVQKEIITADQRSGIRAPTSSSSQNFIEEVRRQRWQRKHAAGFSTKRARSVSLVSDTIPSEVSHSSSIVREYKLHPEWLNERCLDSEQQARRRPRKTSFDPFDRTSDAGVLACRLPGRTITTFASEKKQPSSILKHSAKGKEMEPITSTERRKGGLTMSTAQASVSPAEATRQADEPASACKREPNEQPSVTPSNEEVKKQKSKLGKPPSVKVAVEERPIHSAGKTDSKDGCGQYFEEIIEQGYDSPEFLQSSSPSMTSSPGTPATSPFRLSSQTSSSPATAADLSPPNAQTGKRSVDSYTAWASQLMSAPGSRLLRTYKVSSPKSEEPYSPADKSTVNSSAFELQAQASGWNLLEALQRAHMQTFTDINQLYTKAVSPTELRPERHLEVRGVLKAGRSTTSLQPSAHVRHEGAVRRNSLASLDNDGEATFGYPPLLPCRPIVGDTAKRRMMVRQENGASARRIVIASQPYVAGDMPSSFLDSGDEQVSSCTRLRALMMTVRPALIAGTAYTAIFGNLMSLNTVPTRHAVVLSLGCGADECPVNWWNWWTVAFPASIACCLIIWIYVYCSHLVSCDEEIEEQTHTDMSNCARARLRTMKRHTVRETLLIYWLIGIPFTYGAYNIGHPESHLEGPLFGLSVVVMSVVPGLTCRKCWSHRMLSWETISARLPWNVIIMLGCVLALTRVVEVLYAHGLKIVHADSFATGQKYSLVQSFLNQLDDQFWRRRSIKANQFILVSLAALLSEMVVGETLGEILDPVVVRVAVATNCSAAFYVVPVSLAASINVMLPVSLPLLIIREYLNIKCVKMVAYGVFLKCTAVLAIVASMNSLGTVFFSGEPVAKVGYTFSNASHTLSTLPP